MIPTKTRKKGEAMCLPAGPGTRLVRGFTALLVLAFSLWGVSDTKAQPSLTCQDSAVVAYSITSGSGSVSVPATAMITSSSALDSFAIAFMGGMSSGDVVVPCDSLDGGYAKSLAVMVYGYSAGTLQDSCETYVRILDDGVATLNELPGDVSVSTGGGNCFSTMVTLETPVVYDGCFGDTVMTFYDRSDGLSMSDSFPVGNTAVTWYYDDPHTDDTLWYTNNVIVEGNPLIVTDSLQFAIRDCDGNDTIDHRDNLEFGCSAANMEVTFVAPYVVSCNNDTIWGTLPGAIPIGIVYNNNGGTTADPPTVTMQPTYNGGQLQWCFTHTPSGYSLCYHTLRYVWKGDDQNPMVNAPANITLYTSNDTIQGFGVGPADDCQYDTIANIAMLAFDAASCERSGCVSSPVYPLLDSTGTPAMAICDTFFSDPPDNIHGGFYTDNCGTDGVTVEFSRSYWRQCVEETVGDMSSSSPMPTGAATQIDTFQTATGNDPNNLYDFGPGYHQIVVRVTDGADLTASDTFWITIIDDEDPNWDTESSKRQNDAANLIDSLNLISWSEKQPAGIADSTESSVELRLLVDGNDTTFLTDLDKLGAFLPTATDECFTPQDSVWESSGDYSSFVNINCDTVAISSTTDSFTYSHIIGLRERRFSARDSCGNMLDNSIAGDERYVVRLFVGDFQAPVWDPAYDYANDCITDTAKVPVSTNLMETTITSPSTPDPRPLNYLSEFQYTAGDTLKLYMSDFGITASMDSCAIPAASLSPYLSSRAVDCADTITYTYTVVASPNCYGNGIPVDADSAGFDGPVYDSIDASAALANWPAAIYDIVYTATDECGLTSTYTFLMKIIDDVEPEWQNDCLFGGGFTGAYSPSNWVHNERTSRNSYEFVNGSLRFTGDRDTENRLCITIPNDATISFEVTDDGYDSDVEVDVNDGEPEYEISNMTTVTQVVLAGDEFCFEYEADDDDMLDLTISNWFVNDGSDPFLKPALPGNCHNVVAWNPPSARDNCRGATDVDVTAVGPDGNEITLWGGSNGSCEDALGFTGDFLSTNWVYHNNGGDGYYDESGAPEYIELYSADDSVGATANTEFCINITEDGVINFDYEGTEGSDPDGNDTFGISTDNAVNMSWIYGAGSGTIFGSYSVIVEDGDVFCFVMAEDGDTDASGVRISNFNFQCADNHVYGSFPVGVSTVTYIATDYCGMPLNQDTCQFTVTITDEEAPVALAVDTIHLEANADCEAYLSVAMVDAGSWDACYLEYMWLEEIGGGHEGESFTLSGEGLYDFELIVRDSSGNHDTTTTVVYVNDTQDPVITCTPYYLRGTADGECKYTANGTEFDASAYDQCDLGVLYATIGNDGFETLTLGGQEFELGTTEVTWIATDGTGNTAQCVTVIEVVDNTNPEMTCMNWADTTDASDNTCGTNVDYMVSASDNCNVNTMGSSPASGSFFDVGTTTVTAWAIDDAGNSDTCYFEVTVVDGTDPTLVCSDITVGLDVSGNASITPQMVATATDNCGEVTGLTLSDNAFDCDDIESGTAEGTVDVVVTATDAAGNTSTCEVTVTVQDYAEGWEFVFCPADVETDNGGNPTLCSADVTLPQPQIQAGCSDVLTLDYSDASRDDGEDYDAPYPVGSTTVTWTYSSGSSQITCQYNVNVDDVVAPVVSGCPSDVTVMMENMGQCGAMEVSWTEPTASDECSSVLVMNRSHAPGNVFGAGSTLVSYEWEDAAGNAATCEFTVTVVDTIRPELECPFGQVVSWGLDECGLASIPLINFGVGYDNCGIEERCVKIDLNGDGDFDEEGEMICNQNLEVDCSMLPYTEGETYLWYWVKDKNGNVSDTCDIALTVFDSIKPATCLYDETIETTVEEKDECSANYTYSLPFVICTDQGGKPVCDGSRDAGSAFLYDNDTCNVSVTYAVYQVADCDGPVNIPLTDGTETFSDLGDGLNITLDWPVGTSMVVVELSDNHYTVYDTGYVTVEDVIAPFAGSTGPEDVTVGTNQGYEECASEYTWTHPMLLDNCVVDSVVMHIDYADGTHADVVVLDGAQQEALSCPDLGDHTAVFPKGVSSITYDAYDVCGDERNVTLDIWSFEVTVNDSTPVVVEACPAPVCDEDGETAIVYLRTNSKGPGVCQPNSFDSECECFGRYENTVSFTEDCDTLTITKHIYKYVDGAVEGGAVETDVATYGAKTTATTYEFAIDDTLYKGDYYYEVIAEDCGGYLDTCSFVVRVIDTEEPEILDCPADITMDALAGECSAEVWWDIPMMFNDNCKVIDDWSCSAEHEGADIKVTSVDPAGCDSKVDFKGQWSPGFWTWTNNSGGSHYNHTQTTLSITDGTACVDVPNDGQVSFRVVDGNGTVTVGGTTLNVTSGTGTGNDYTVNVSEGDEMCVSSDGTIEVENFQFLCGGSQHKGTFPVGVSTVTYTVSDGMYYDSCGVTYGPNYTTCEITVTVEDNEDPVAMCQDITVQVINGYDVSITAEDIDGGSSDNCNKIASKTINGQSTFGCADVGQTISVELEVSDEAGNTATCTADVTVQEVANPTVSSCPGSQTLTVDGTCEAVLTYATPQVVTGCETLDMTWVSGPLSGASLAPGNYTVTYSYTSNGGTLTCQFAVTVEDATAPTFEVVVEGIAVNDGDAINITTAPGMCSATASWVVENVSDNCDASPSVSASHASGGVFAVGCTQVTVTATDDSGNASSMSFEICVSDNEAPLATCQDATVSLDDSGEATVAPLDVLTLVQDDCGIDELELSQSTFTCADLGSDNPETITVSDAGGNETVCSFNVTVIDEIAPVAACQDITVYVDEAGEVSITTGDVDGGSDDNTDCYALSIDVDAFTCDALGDNSVELTITDDAGLSDNCEATVTVEDAIAPELESCPADQSVTTDEGICGAVVSYDAPEYSDNCAGGSLSLEEGLASGETFPLGTTTVTYTFGDASGNGTTEDCTFEITVTDGEAPSITCPADIVDVGNDAGECGAVVEYEVTADDNCGVSSLSLVSGPASGDMFDVGTTEVTWRAEDAAGNETSCSFSVTVEDVEAPTLDGDCPANATLSATLNECDQIYTWTPPAGATDNCDGAFGRASGKIVEVLTDPAGNTNTIVAQYDYEGALPAGLQQAQFPVGTSTVQYIATDDTGNEAVICEFTVTVTDNQAPGMICPSAQVVSSTCDDFPIADYTGMPATFDNCSNSVTVSQSPAAGTMLGSAGVVDANSNGMMDEGDHFTVTLTATDGSGNSNECSFTVVLDNFGEPVPAVSPLPVLTGDCGELCVDAPIAYDECGNTIYGVPSLANGVCGDNQFLYTSTPGLYNVLWTYEDANGNSRSQLQQIMVTDDESAPEVACQSSLTVELDAAGTASIDVAAALVSGSDNCTDAESLVYSLSQTDFDCSFASSGNAGVWINEFHYDNGGADVGEFVEVAGQAGTDLSGYELVFYNGSFGGQYAAYPLSGTIDDEGAGYGAVDVQLPSNGLQNGSPDGIALVNGGSVVEFLSYEGTFDAIDGPAAGMTSTDVGVAEPSSTPQGYSLQLTGSGSTGAAFTWSGPDVASPGELNAGQTINAGAVVTLSAEDEAGNVGTCEVTVIVVDNTAPEAVCADAFEVSLDASGAASVTVEDIDAGSNDNCGVTDLAIDVSSFDCLDIGINEVNLIVADGAGNADTCTASVVILDNEAPEALCVESLTLELDETGFAAVSASDIDEGSNDACGISSMNLSLNRVAKGFEGIYAPANWSAVIDGDGSVDVTDVPNSVTLIGADDGTAEAETNLCITVPADGQISFDWSYSSANSSAFWDPFGYILNGSFIQLTTTAGGLNQGGSLSLAVSAGDNLCFSQQSVDGFGGAGTTTISNFIVADQSFGCENVGADNLLTLTVVDVNGNVNECTTEVTVFDNVAPVITCSDDVVTCCAANTVSASAEDACGIADISYAGTMADGSTVSGSGSEVSADFPVGVSSVTFTATDANGNTSECTVTVEVTDGEDPIPACKSNINVTIGSDGTVTLPAMFFDGGSFDVGCGTSNEISSAMIGVNGGDLGSTYTFSCDELGMNEYRLEVSDCAGNTAMCWGNVLIEDKKAPNCDAADVTVDVSASCEATLTAEQLGAATTDNCSAFEDIALLVNGEASITVDVDHVPGVPYTLTATDAQGNVSTCSGFITVTTEGVQCATDPIVLQLDDAGQASLTQADLEAAIGLMIPSCAAAEAAFAQSEFDCSDIGSNIIGITITSDAGGISTCAVEVVVEDNIAPDCGNIPAQVIELDGNGEGAIDLVNLDLTSITDNCTGFDDLSLVFNPGGPFDCDDVGSQNFTVTATDESGNATDCEVSVEVVDLQGPGFTCDDSHVLVLNGAGQGFLEVEDIIEGDANDNCGIEDEWLSQTSFDCTELGVHEVTAYVEDVNGNVNTCVTTVEVVATDLGLNITANVTASGESAPGANDGAADVISVTNGFGTDITDDVTYLWSGPNGYTATTASIGGLEPGAYCVLITNTNTGCATLVCVEVDPAAAPQTVSLAGTLTTDYGVDIQCADVILGGDDAQTMSSNANGGYTFDVAYEGDYTVTPYSNANLTQGVKTSDLVYIQLHVLNLLQLDNPYKVIAADADNNGMVSTIDLVYLQALILGNISELPNNTSWRFVDADHVFTNANDPWSTAFPESISYTDVQTDQLDGDFVAIKIGDVTEEANTACAGGGLEGGVGIGSRDAGTLQMVAQDAQVTAGEAYRVDVHAKDFNNLLGYQMTVNFDATALELTEVVPGVVRDLTEANFGLNRADEGQILTNWFNAQGETVADDEVLFTLVFTAREDAARLSDLVGLASDGPLSNEAYSRDGKYNVNLEFVGEDAPVYALLQNTPNPFKDQTIIGFVLPADAAASITLMDASGRVLKVIDGAFNQGYNEVQVNRNDVPAAGVIYYQLQTEGYTATKQMIVIE